MSVCCAIVGRPTRRMRVQSMKRFMQDISRLVSGLSNLQRRHARGTSWERESAIAAASEELIHAALSFLGDDRLSYGSLLFSDRRGLGFSFYFHRRSNTRYSSAGYNLRLHGCGWHHTPLFAYSVFLRLPEINCFPEFMKTRE